MAECTLEGAEQLIKSLNDIDEAITTKWIRTALRDGAKVIAQECVATAPEESGITRKAIKVRAGKRTRTGINILVTLSKKFFPVKGNWFYIGFVDRGHLTGMRDAVARRNAAARTKKGLKPLNLKPRRPIPGTFWLEKAYEKTVGRAFEVICQTLKEGLDQEIAKARKS